MAPRPRLDLRPGRIAGRIGQRVRLNPNWRFATAVARLIWRHRAHSVAIILVTIVQEIVALWPVNLLGQFVDRLQSGDLGDVVWRFMGASLLYPAILRGGVILRHKMFYETDRSERVELTLDEADQGDASDVEVASAAHTRVINAVSGITNAAYHLLGSFTPVVIKIVVVSGNLLAYNVVLGTVYLASLTVPLLMTAVFNKKLSVLLDTQYAVISATSGLGVKAIAEQGAPTVRERFEKAMHERKAIMIALVTRSQSFLYLREAALVGSQFIVVFLALHMRQEIGLTPGDFTRIVGYTTQVAAAFITTASVLDAIVSYTRAYHVFAVARRR